MSGDGIWRRMGGALTAKASAPKLLSVLIPSLRSRMKPLKRLLQEIDRQIDNRTDVEVLTLIDNYAMPLGRKRNLLLDMASGKYLTFVNDDDWIAENWLESITAAMEPEVDVVAIRAVCLFRKNPLAKWEHLHTMATSLATPRALFLKTGDKSRDWMVHAPAMWCVWRSEVAKAARFPEQTYSEDTEWMQAARSLARTERIVPKPLYLYYADDTTSEAGRWRNENAIPIECMVYEKSVDLVREHRDLLVRLDLLLPEATA